MVLLLIFLIIFFKKKIVLPNKLAFGFFNGKYIHKYYNILIFVKLFLKNIVPGTVLR